MGYELHITRADDWVDSEQTPIRLDELLEVLASDTRLLIMDDGDPARSVPAVWVWKGETGPSLTWSSGQITVKGVRSQDELQGLKTLAARLGATLLGDDGERYSG